MRAINRICKGQNLAIGFVAFSAGIIVTFVFFGASGHEWSTRFAWTTISELDEYGKLCLLHNMYFIIRFEGGEVQTS